MGGLRPLFPLGRGWKVNSGPIIQSVRMKISQVQGYEPGSGGMYRMQLARIYLCTPSGDAWLWPTGTTATSTIVEVSSNEGVGNLILNPATTNGKYCSTLFSANQFPNYITITTSIPIPLKYSHWRWKSANDAISNFRTRNPRDFAFEILIDGVWQEVDSKTNCPQPSGNLVTAYEGTWWSR